MHGLEFGLTIPQRSRGENLPLEEENDPVKQYEFSKSISVLAHNVGFDSIYAYDHFNPIYSNDRNIFEYFTLLSALATITRRIKIGQIVTCNSCRNPSLLAKMMSTLDNISNARTELGIGAGWNQPEYLAYGYQFPKNLTTEPPIFNVQVERSGNNICGEVLQSLLGLNLHSIREEWNSNRFSEKEG